jgi:hypothetical protein
VWGHPENTEDEQLRTNGKAITKDEQAAICSIVWFANAFQGKNH